MKKDRKQKRLKRKQTKREIIKIYPMISTKYNYLERKKLREAEKMILSGIEVDIEQTNQKVKKLEKNNRK